MGCGDAWRAFGGPAAGGGGDGRAARYGEHLAFGEGAGIGDVVGADNIVYAYAEEVGDGPERVAWADGVSYRGDGGHCLRGQGGSGYGGDN